MAVKCYSLGIYLQKKFKELVEGDFVATFEINNIQIYVSKCNFFILIGHLDTLPGGQLLF